MHYVTWVARVLGAVAEASRGNLGTGPGGSSGAS